MMVIIIDAKVVIMMVIIINAKVVIIMVMIIRSQGGDAGEPPAAAFPLPIFHLEKRNLVSGIIV